MELKTYYIVKIFTTSIEYLKCNHTNTTGIDVKVSILCVNETIIWLKTEIKHIEFTLFPKAYINSQEETVYLDYKGDTPWFILPIFSLSRLQRRHTLIYTANL